MIINNLKIYCNRIHIFKDFVGLRVWKYLLLSILVGIVLFLVESSFVLILQGFLVSISLLRPDQVLLPEWFPVGPNWSLITLIIFGLFRSLAFMLKGFLASSTQTAFSSDQRKRFVEYGLSNVSKFSLKSLITVFTEVTTQSGVVVYFFSLLVNVSISAILFFGYGLHLAFYETIIAVSLLAIFLIPMKLISRKISKHGNGIVDEFEKINDLVLGGIRNNFLLKLYGLIEREKKRAYFAIDAYEKHFKNYSFISGLVTSIPLFLGVIVISAVSFISIKYIQTSPIKLVAFFYIFLRLAQAASEAVHTISYIKLNMPGIRKLYHWYIEYNKYIQVSRDSVQKIKMNEINNIKISNVSFGYEKDKMLFENITFSLKRSEILVLKGESGVGKSSLLSLIVGIIKPVTGSILINDSIGSDSCEMGSKVSYVGPEAFLINGTIKENLLFGIESKKISEVEIWSILKIADLEDLVKKLPEQMDYFLHEGGGLSTGQKQRLSIARALLREPDLLILDEATANLDSQTEAKIIANLSTSLKHMMTVIVSHRDSFDQLATSLITLKRTTII